MSTRLAVARREPLRPGAVPRPGPAEPLEETIWVPLATAADRILGNPALDAGDAELVARHRHGTTGLTQS